MYIQYTTYICEAGLSLDKMDFEVWFYFKLLERLDEFNMYFSVLEVLYNTHLFKTQLILHWSYITEV